MHSTVHRTRTRPTPDAERLHLTASEVGSIVGVTPATVRRWVALGILPARRLGPGRRILVDPADLEVLLVSGASDAADDGVAEEVE